MSMEVACPQCGAKYQFDASAIPAEGYDAQCTGCGSVFFVSPEANAPPPADPEISVSCEHCGTVYRFPASAVPAQGYDAQCTQCEKVFFVSPPDAGAVDAGAVAAPEPAPTAVEATVEEASAPVDEEPVTLTSPKPSPSEPAVNGASPAAATDQLTADVPGEPMPEEPVEPQLIAAKPEEPITLEPPADAEPPATAVEPMSPTSLEGGLEEPFVDSPNTEPGDGEALAAAVLGPSSETQEAGSASFDMAAEEAETPSSEHDMIALSMELGEPDDPPEGASLEEDFTTIIQRRRRHRLIALAVVVALGIYTFVTYHFAPRVFDLTIGRVVQVKLTIDPEAIPHVNEGLARMLDDTDAAYQEAIVTLDAALAIDDQFPDAIALSGLAHVFRGADIQARGKAVRQRGEAALTELQALEALPAGRRPGDTSTRITDLRDRANTASRESAELFESGGKILRDGFARLRTGLEAYQDEPLVVEAAGIYYTTDSDSISRARELLRHSLALRFGPDGGLDLAAPPNAWLPFLQGLVRGSEKKKQDGTRAAFAAALKATPGFQRARYELARFEERHGRTAEAQRIAREILAKVADHDKAKQLLERLEATTTVSSHPTTPAPGKGKKRRRKRR